MKYLELFEDFESEFKKQLWGGKYLYHFTLTDNLEEILEEGLIPRKYPNSYYPEGCEGVFLTTKEALFSANLPQSLLDEFENSWNGDELEFNPIIRLKVNISDLDIDKFYPDDDYLMSFNKRLGDTRTKILDSLTLGTGLCYKGVIPKENIVEHTTKYPF